MSINLWPQLTLRSKIVSISRRAIAYRKAAELSDDAELARTATRLSFTYRFNDEALLAAKRWQKLDKESDEARAFLASCISVPTI